MSDGISGLLMVSAKGFSRGKLGEEEEAWKVGTETNVTRWQLNAVLPSKGCMFFARTGRGGQRTGKISSQRFVNLSVVFFFCAFFLPIFGSFLYAHRSLYEDKRGGAREGGKKGGRAYKSEEYFTAIGFALVMIFAVYCSHVCLISRRNHELLADCWVY